MKDALTTPTGHPRHWHQREVTATTHAKVSDGECRDDDVNETADTACEICHGDVTSLDPSFRGMVTSSSHSGVTPELTVTLYNLAREYCRCVRECVCVCVCEYVPACVCLPIGFTECVWFV